MIYLQARNELKNQAGYTVQDRVSVTRLEQWKGIKPTVAVVLLSWTLTISSRSSTRAAADVKSTY